MPGKGLGIDKRPCSAAVSHRRVSRCGKKAFS
jgi:hypothetical protein